MSGSGTPTRAVSLEPDRLALSAAEVAQALGVTRQHVYTLLRSGRLRSIKIGRCRRIPIEALHEMLAGGGGDVA